MKKMKLNLFIKTSLIIFILIAIISAFYTQLLLDEKITTYISHINNNVLDESQLVMELQRYFIDKNLSDINTFQKMNQLKGEREILDAYFYENFYILDQSYQIVNYDQYLDSCFLTCSIGFEGEIYRLDFLTYQQIQEINRIILQNYQNNKETYFICHRKNDTNDFSKNHIQYLAIDDYVIIDGESDGAEKYLINWYHSKDIYFDDGTLINQGQIRQDIIETIDFQNEASYDGIVRNANVFDDSIYGCYYTKIKDGYILYLSTLYDYVNELRDEVVRNTSSYYLGAFILSLAASFIVSCMITKRIRKINTVTKMIADNHFDIRLKEKPNDELGELSANINKMSLHLDQTIHQLNNDIDRITKLENIKKKFIAQFTHEIKTPLSIINGHIELLQFNISDDEKNNCIETINEQITKINHLILQMLDLSKLETANIQLNIEDIELENLVLDMIDEQEFILQKKHLTVQLESDEFVILKADKNKMEMVIRNFMTNAIKHSIKSVIIIKISQHELSVFNYGHQIEDTNKIWLSFVSDDQKGTGLGLAICKNILEMHGFNYGVRNHHDGVEFYFQY